MKSKSIIILPVDELRIIKQIFLIKESKHNDNDVSIGYILYERKFTDDYKFTQTPKEKRDFKYYLEYPRQDSYPNDSIDDLILQSIQNIYPNQL